MTTLHPRGAASTRGDTAARAPVLLVFSGAGLSAESGVSTFRGPGGLYEGMRAESVLSAEGLRAEPERVHRFCDDRRRHLGTVTPNAAHDALAALQRARPTTILLTQNVDDLLERAGATSVVHLHGQLLRLRCLGFNHALTIGYERDPALRCPKCRSRLRPDVVLFNEAAPEYRTMYRAFNSLRAGDALLVVGTQGNVIPIGTHAAKLRARGIRTALVNLDPSPDLPERAFDLVHYAPATSGVPLALKALEFLDDDVPSSEGR